MAELRPDFLWKKQLCAFTTSQVVDERSSENSGTLRVSNHSTAVYVPGRHDTAFQAQSWDFQALGPSFL